MKISFVCHWNNKKILDECLKKKSFTEKDDELILLSGYNSMASAYIEGERRAKNNILVFVHQDVLLSKKWRLTLARQIKEITKKDPLWGVIGVLGFYIDGNDNFKRAGQGESSTYKFSHQVGNLPLKVNWIDGVICIKRKGVLSFDPNVPKFHGTMEDLCELSRQEGRGIWVANLYTKHFSQEINRNSEDIWECANYIIGKWDKLVPVGAAIFWPTNKTYRINNWSEIMRDKNGNKVPLGAVELVSRPDKKCKTLIFK